MKKIILSLAAIAALTAFTACGNRAASTADDEVATDSICGCDTIEVGDTIVEDGEFAVVDSLNVEEIVK